MAREEIFFPKGLLGFEEHQHFAISWEPQQAPFSILETADGSLHFILVPICEITPEYLFEATEQEAELLEYQESDECVLYAIVTMPSDPAQMTANLQGPVVINLNKKRGLQAIRPEYELRYPVLEGYKQTLALRERGQC